MDGVADHIGGTITSAGVLGECPLCAISGHSDLRYGAPKIGIGFGSFSQHRIQAHNLLIVLHSQEIFVELRYHKPGFRRHVADMVGMMRVADFLLAPSM